MLRGFFGPKSGPSHDQGMTADRAIDVFGVTIYVNPGSAALAERFSSTRHPEVELHYALEFRTPPPPPN